MFGLAVGLRAQGPALIRHTGPAGPGGNGGYSLLHLAKPARAAMRDRAPTATGNWQLARRVSLTPSTRITYLLLCCPS